MILKVPGLGPFKRVQRCARSMQPSYATCVYAVLHMPWPKWAYALWFGWLGVRKWRWENWDVRIERDRSAFACPVISLGSNAIMLHGSLHTMILLVRKIVLNGKKNQKNRIPDKINPEKNIVLNIRWNKCDKS